MAYSDPISGKEAISWLRYWHSKISQSFCSTWPPPAHSYAVGMGERLGVISGGSRSRQVFRSIAASDHIPVDCLSDAIGGRGFGQKCPFSPPPLYHILLGHLCEEESARWFNLPSRQVTRLHCIHSLRHRKAPNHTSSLIKNLHEIESRCSSKVLFCFLTYFIPSISR